MDRNRPSVSREGASTKARRPPSQKPPASSPASHPPRAQEMQDFLQDATVTGTAVSMASLPADTVHVRQLLSVMHTNPDCRYSELKMKRLATVVGYLPIYGLHPNTATEDRQAPLPHESNEPVFFINALNFCLQYLLPKQRGHLGRLRAASLSDPVPTSLTSSTPGCGQPSDPLPGPSAVEELVVNLLRDTRFVLPQFFNGPLSAAVDSVQRAPGCAWPPLLLFLYCRQGLQNRRFVVDVLCRSRDFPKALELNATLMTAKSTPVARIKPASRHTNSLAGDESGGGVKPKVTAVNDGAYNCIHSLLMERGVKLIPWNCSTLSNRSILASAFRGTRLEQMMAEMCPETDLPCFVALGRNSKGTVVCCKLGNARGIVKHVLTWLNTVTRAHFADYEVERWPEQSDDVTTASNLEQSEPPTLKRISPSGERLVHQRLQMKINEQVKFEPFLRSDVKISRHRTKTVYSSFQQVNRSAKTKAFTIMNGGVAPPLKRLLPNPNASRYHSDRETSFFTNPDHHPIDRKSIEAMHRFVERFNAQFTTSLPVGPGFIFTRFSTAVARCLDPNTQEIKPLLLYLHDDNGPGAPHFVANVLCSQRFNNRLYDCGIGIWPVDLTGTISTKRGQEGLEKCENDPEKLQMRKNSSYWVRLLMRCQLNANFTASGERNVSLVDHREFPLQAIALLRLLSDHPAGDTVCKILSGQNLPSLVSVGLKQGRFFVSSTLNPSATTKQSVNWLARVLASFDQRHAEDALT